jgi:hypothetical protein
MRVLQMKKIPTLFEREYSDHMVVGIKPVLTSPDLQWVLDGEGIATEKIDGACCALIGNLFYKRYDAKNGKKPPEGAIPCSEPDPVTGHWPHWVRVKNDDPASRWYIVALENALKDTEGHLNNGTYEAIGPHFQGNPHHLDRDILVRHGITVLDVPRTFEGLRDYLEQHEIEGIVFWKDGEPQCKIKRSDFGFKWPV